MINNMKNYNDQSEESSTLTNLRRSGNSIPNYSFEQLRKVDRPCAVSAIVDLCNVNALGNYYISITITLIDIVKLLIFVRSRLSNCCS